MKKNVEVMGGGIKCDNPQCDYIDENVKISEYKDWHNKPCPKCGSNLLTDEDYGKILMMMEIFDVFNEMDITPKIHDEERAIAQIDVHNNKIEIIDIESPYDQKKIDEKLKGKKGSKGDKTSD